VPIRDRREGLSAGAAPLPISIGNVPLPQAEPEAVPKAHCRQVGAYQVPDSLYTAANGMKWRLGVHRRATQSRDCRLVAIGDCRVTLARCLQQTPWKSTVRATSAWHRSTSVSQIAIYSRSRNPD